eukprot:gene7559-9838_t
MENYQKNKFQVNTEQKQTIEDPDIFTFMTKSGSKIQQAVSLVQEALLKDGQAAIIGIGQATTKAVSIAEILKRTMLKQSVRLTQDTKLFQSKITETWAPKADVEEPLEKLQVIRKVPGIKITYFDVKKHDKQQFISDQQNLNSKDSKQHLKKQNQVPRNLKQSQDHLQYKQKQDSSQIQGHQEQERSKSSNPTKRKKKPKQKKQPQDKESQIKK